MRNGLLLFFLFLSLSPSPAAPSPANRLAHLDEFCDPYLPSHAFPRLTTPQWVGEKEVDAVVLLAIDDMNQYAAYEVYLRPILERLKQIDGRAPASIMANNINLTEPHLQVWLKEGVTLETHTASHPCPILAGGNFAKAKSDYDRCVDHFFNVPNNRPVAFRTPCMDGINSSGPRLFAEILGRTTTNGQYLTMSSSVAHLFTPDDPDLPKAALLDAAGKPRFAKYLADGFVNYVRNYPYPYVIAGLIWELPFSVPDDYQGFRIQGNINPKTLADMEASLDLVVARQGLYTQCFHPYPWIANTQMVAFIDHAVAKHGKKVKFLSFREIEQRLNHNLLADEPLRATNGQANGVRLLDLNHDGYLDVVIGNEQLRQTRVWDPARQTWKTFAFPAALVHVDSSGNRQDGGVRFGVLDGDRTIVLVRNEHETGAWRYQGDQWLADPNLLKGLDLDGQPVFTARQGRDRGVRLRDINNDQSCELIVGNDTDNAVFAWQSAEQLWKRLPYGLPKGVSIVNARGQDNGLRFVDLNNDGAEDIVFSNQDAYSIHLMVPSLLLGFAPGWSREVLRGSRGQMPEVPAIARSGDYPNNGAWFAQGEMRVQNEDTDKLPHLIARYSYAELLSGMQPPPLAPAEALATIQVPTNFVVELVATEPQVLDPVNLDWGPDGRMWVVEMRDYPNGIDGKGKPGGVITVLEDPDGDGRYDKATTFLDGLNYPNGIMTWNRGVLISAAPDILYAEDTDGDGKADKVEKLFTGFGEGNQQHRFNGFEYGLDNWLYGANGDSGGSISPVRGGSRGGGQQGKRISLSGHDFRFRPEAMTFEVVSGHSQYGRRRDDWGNWFGNNNAVWLWHYWISERYLKRNPRLPVDSIQREPANYVEAGRVYPVGRKQQRMNDIGAAGHVTSANSPTPYRDELFGENFAGALFISEPSHNLIRCERLQADGVSFGSTRFEQQSPREFLASTDPWFRPTGLKIGPDGALYIADMYRQFIEHPEWIPDDIKRRSDMRAGSDQGRIYRVYPKGAVLRRPPRLNDLDLPGLVKAMDHPNGWQRDTIQRLLVSRGDKAAIEPLRALLAFSTNPKARLTALCTLDGLSGLRVDDLIKSLKDPHPALREHALRISETRLRPQAPAPLVEAVLARVDDDNLRVRFQLALSLGEYDQPKAAQALARLALRDARQPDLVTAILSSCAKRPGEILETLFASGADLAPLERLTSHLVMWVASSGQMPETGKLVARLAQPAGTNGLHAAWQISAFARLLSELEKNKRALGEIKGAPDALPGLLASARRLAQDPNQPVERRSAALTLLGREPASEGQDIDVLASLLPPQIPDSLQQAALTRLGQIRSDAVPAAITSGWSGLAPTLRAQALELLLRRERWTQIFLDRLEAKEIAAQDLGAGARQRLLSHANNGLRQRAQKLLEQPIDRERQKLVASYLPEVQKASGDASRGAALFTTHCAACHRLHGQGNGAAPDLASVVDRSPERMLIAILDPNRAVEDRYVNYLVETKAGEQLSGILTGESANSITLVGASGTRETILRSDVVSLKSTRLSLMPEGFEQLLKPQDIANLLAYIEASATPRRSFPGNQPGLVKADDLGALRLRASNAEIYGDGIAFEAQYHNLGSWNGPHDQAAWSVDVTAPGAYDVWLHWACHDNEAGDRFRFQIAGQSIVAQVPGTKTWDIYEHAKFGRIELPAGKQRAVFQADGTLTNYLIDLLEVRLVPANAVKAPQFEQVGTGHRQAAVPRNR